MSDNPRTNGRYLTDEHLPTPVDVEADSADAAADIANDLDSSEAVRDSFRQREHDWTADAPDTSDHTLKGSE